MSISDFILPQNDLPEINTGPRSNILIDLKAKNLPKSKVANEKRYDPAINIEPEMDKVDPYEETEHNFS